MARAFRKIRKFFQLPARVRSVFMAAVVGEPLVRLLLRLKGCTGAVRVTETVAVKLSGLWRNASAQETEQGFNLAMRQLPGRDGCLSRAVTLYALLRANNHLVKLKVGVQKDCNALAAHAWVELNDQAMAPDGKLRDRFEPLGSIAG